MSMFTECFLFSSHSVVMAISAKYAVHDSGHVILLTSIHPLNGVFSEAFPSIGAKFFDGDALCKIPLNAKKNFTKIFAFV